MALANIANFVTKSIDVTALDTADPLAPQDLYTCPNNFICLVRLLHLSNGSGNNKHITVYWYEAATTTRHALVDNFALAANSMQEVIEGGGYLALKPGDKLQCVTDTANVFHVTMSGEEHFQPTLG